MSSRFVNFHLKRSEVKVESLR